MTAYQCHANNMWVRGRRHGSPNQDIYFIVLQCLQTRCLDSVLIIMPGHVVSRTSRNTGLCLVQVLLHA